MSIVDHLSIVGWKLLGFIKGVSDDEQHPFTKNRETDYGWSTDPLFIDINKFQLVHSLPEPFSLNLSGEM